MGYLLVCLQKILIPEGWPVGRGGGGCVLLEMTYALRRGKYLNFFVCIGFSRELKQRQWRRQRKRNNQNQFAFYQTSSQLFHLALNVKCRSSFSSHSRLERNRLLRTLRTLVQELWQNFELTTCLKYFRRNGF